MKNQYPRIKKFSSTTLRSQTILWKKHCFGIGKEHRVWNLKVSISIKEKQGFILCMESHIVKSLSNTDSGIQYRSNKENQRDKITKPMSAVWELKAYQKQFSKLHLSTMRNSFLIWVIQRNQVLLPFYQWMEVKGKKRGAFKDNSFECFCHVESLSPCPFLWMLNPRLE